MPIQTADLYLRLSLDHPGATAIERQEADCRRWCDAHGVAVRTVHIDRGISGYLEITQAHRDGFTAALNAVATGETQLLVVWKLDRLSRRGVGQVGPLLDQLEHVGGRLVSVKDGLDTAQPQARMIVALLSEFARAESETMGVRIKSVMEAKRARGEWLSGKPPFGYEIAEDRRLRPVEPAASMMRQVFDMVVKGHTLFSICDMLNEAGMRNGRGSKFTVTVLSSALRTPAYAGLTPARHVNAKGQHAPGVPALYRDSDTGETVSCLTEGAEPIVSRARQLEVLKILEARMRRFGRGRAPRRPAYALLLRGLGRCASCRWPVITNNGYRCFPLDRTGHLVCEQPVCATVSAVDKRVSETWLDLLCSGTGASEPLRRAVAERWMPVAAPPPYWMKLNSELRDLQARLEDADDALYVRGDLDSRRHALIIERLSIKIAQTQDALTAIEPRIDTRGLLDRDYAITRWNEHAAAGRRDLLRLAWSQILLVKAAKPGGSFGQGRIAYVPVEHEA